VFQEKSVKDIIEEIIKDYSGKKEFRLNATYPKLDYCVHYDETDFDFISRLMEGAGIYYFFEHTDSDHTMVMIDKMLSHKSKEGEGPIKWGTDLRYQSTIKNWRSQEDARSVKVVVADHDYLATVTKIEATKPATKPAEKLGTMEVYEYPANVVQNGVKDASQPATTAATDACRRHHGRADLAAAAVPAAPPTSATWRRRTTFKLDGFASGRRHGEYLIVTPRYELEFAQHEAIEDLKGLASATALRPT
jgi:type VI secretion system secreted protein VgrG